MCVWCVYIYIHTHTHTHTHTYIYIYIYIYTHIYIRVSFCNGSFYDDSLLRPLSSRTEHSRLVEHHCRNSSVLSLLSVFLALFRCACFFFFYLSAVLLIVIFPPMTSIKKTEKKKKSKQLTLHSLLISSEPRPGPSSTK